MKFEEYRRYDATGLAELIKKKEVSPAELLETAIQRTTQINPAINAVVTKLYEAAQEQLKQLDLTAPLAGVPYLIKDLGPQLKGTRYTCASRLLKNNISTENSEVTNRMLKAGLVIFGKSNTSEFGLNPFVENELFGPSNNPWNTAYTTGGSSGGSAAAVAAGIVPMASANDGGGSIRIPASCNGLFGLKPTRGRISLAPFFADNWSGATCEGVVSRSVRDTALYYDLMQGPTDGEPYIIEKPALPYTEEIKQAPRTLKIAYSYAVPQGLNLSTDEENIKAIQHTVALLRSLGHQVEEVALPFTADLLSELLYMLVMGELSGTLDYVGKLRGAKPRYHEVEPNTWLLYKLGKSFTASDFTLAKMKWNEIGRKMGTFHKQYDLLLTPTLGMRPFKTGALQTSKIEEKALRLMNALGISSIVKHTGIIEKTSAKIFNWIPYPPLANITGQPSASVPLYWTNDGLPVGVMFTAPVNDEATLLKLGAQLEKAQPWFNRVPAI